MSRLVAITVIILCTSICANAQLLPQYNQYLYNHYLINPAVAGIEDYADLQLGIRSQWSGMEGAPEHSFVSFHSNIEKKSALHPANPPQGKNTAGHLKKVNARTYREYNAIAHHGVGGQVIADKAGPFMRFKVNTTYAYHLPVTQHSSISAGMSLGFQSNQLDGSKITLEDPNDLAVSGIWYYSHNYFVGVSGMQLLSENNSFGEYEFADQVQSKSYNINAGYKWYINDKVFISPSAMVNIMTGQPLLVDANLIANFIGRITAGRFEYG